MGGGQMFEDEDPLDGLDLRYLRDPLEADLRPRRFIGNRYYSEKEAKCAAGCGRSVSVYRYKKGSGEKRRTCGDPSCIHKVLSEAQARRKGERRGPASRAMYGGILPEGTPLNDQDLSEEEINRIIDEGDRKTWRL